MRQPALFLGHGSPMTTITECPERASWQALGRKLAGALRPSAILIVSAHWETNGRVHVTAQAEPPTIHDFRGFPPELFAVRYPAPGSAPLVARLAELLGDALVADDGWGFDHGSWGVMQPMFPDADIPMVQLSLNRALDANGDGTAHLALARKLAVLRDEGVLIVGSGNIFHNLRLFFAHREVLPQFSDPFVERILAAVAAGDDAALTRFAPDDEAAAVAINSGEHYWPLIYTVGARLPGDGVAFFNRTGGDGLAMACVLLGDPSLVEGLTA